MSGTERYLARQLDGRMVALIASHLARQGRVLDLGCGSGLYGPTLRSVGNTVIGIDADPVLCDAARATGAYESVSCSDLAALDDFGDLDAIFCSEVLEHLAAPTLRRIIALINERARSVVVVTVPNPRSPHFRHDPTHVARYTLRSLHAQLDASERFAYRREALGFSHIEMKRYPFLRPFDALARRVSALSPTVAYVGTRRSLDEA